MAKVLVSESSLQDIADAIREKTEGTETFLPSAMGAAIRALETGGKLKSAKGTAQSASTSTLKVTGIDFEPVFFMIAPVLASTTGAAFVCPDGGYGTSSSTCYEATLEIADGTVTIRTSAIASRLKDYYWFAYGY